MKRVILIIALLIFAGAAAATPGPEELSEIYFEHLKNQEWDAVAGLFTVESRGDFRGFMNSIFEMAPAEEQTEIYQMLFQAEVSDEEVAAMSDQDYLAAFLGGVMAQAMGAGINFDSIEIIGTVPEEPNLMHVLARINLTMSATADKPIGMIDVVSWEEGEEGWGLMLSGEIKALGESIRAQFSAMQEQMR
jgi:hypothetical protein